MKDVDGKLIKWNRIWFAKTGSVFSCSSDQTTIYDQTGPGVPLYFIFLKALMFFFLIASIISVYQIWINKKGKSKIQTKERSHPAKYSKTIRIQTEFIKNYHLSAPELMQRILIFSPFSLTFY